MKPFLAPPMIAIPSQGGGATAYLSHSEARELAMSILTLIGEQNAPQWKETGKAGKSGIEAAANELWSSSFEHPGDIKWIISKHCVGKDVAMHCNKHLRDTASLCDHFNRERDKNSATIKDLEARIDNQQDEIARLRESKNKHEIDSNLRNTLWLEARAQVERQKETIDRITSRLYALINAVEPIVNLPVANIPGNLPVIGDRGFAQSIILGPATHQAIIDAYSATRIG